ncbi:MAG: exodeoxyribonuclease III [Streptococcaceae bacterium]|jgi:exodeoxyribonuclease-3|nr:exodeoxyribonuclease III [Streptococcaceae bacterium]
MKYKFISWNIDSLNAAITGVSPRAGMSKNVLENLAQMKPDVLAIQETKLKATGPTKKHLHIIEEMFPGYKIAWRSSDEPARKGYAGVMFLYKESLPQPMITYPKIDAPTTMDDEGRIITLEFPEFFVTQVYTPNSGNGLTRLEDRGVWDDCYRAYLTKLDKVKPVVACGDYNVAFQEIDLKNPRTNRNNPGFTDQEREKFGLLLKAGFTDTFRYKHGDVPEKYTWWAQISKTSKINNSGWRIDYWLVSNRIQEGILNSDMIDSGLRQDHTPILLEIEL